MSTQQNTPAPNLAAITTKILAIGSLTGKAAGNPEFLQVMTREVPATVGLYLDGKIEQWWVKPDASGVVFIVNVADTQTAHDLLEALPLGIAGMMEFQLIPIGPLTPLRFLLNAPQAA